MAEPKKEAICPRLDKFQKENIAKILSYNGDYTVYNYWHIVAVIGKVIGLFDIEWSKDYNRFPKIMDEFHYILTARCPCPDDKREFILLKHDCYSMFCVCAIFDLGKIDVRKYFYEYKPEDFDDVVLQIIE